MEGFCARTDTLMKSEQQQGFLAVSLTFRSYIHVIRRDTCWPVPVIHLTTVGVCFDETRDMDDGARFVRSSDGF
jgi:hypothetical protein